MGAQIVNHKSQTLTQAEVQHIADLARIGLSDEEVQLFRQQLAEVIDYNMSLLGELDLDNVEPTAQTTGVTNVWQDDVVRSSLSQDIALENAPKKRANQFVVKKVLGEA